MRALLVVALLAAPAAAVPGPTTTNTMVVRATRSGYVDVTFKTDFQIDTYDAETRQLTGRVGGFWAERLRQPARETPDTFGILRVRHQGETLRGRVSRAIATETDEDGLEEGFYRPGTYRFHIFTDGEFELSVPTANVGRDLLVTPRRNTAPPRLTIVDGKPSAGNATWEARERITVGTRRSGALSMASVRWNGAGVQQHVLCFAPPGGDCAEDKRHVINGEIVFAVGGQHRSLEAYFAPPGLVTRGRWDAYQRSVTTPGPNFTVMHGLALVFDAPL